MILLLNVKITSYGLSHYDRASWMPVYDRMDIFKYCLASYSVLLPLISKCEFYIEISPEFSHRKEELELYIKELFPENKLNLNWYRHYYTSDWRKWCDNTLDSDNELIWFSGNDDHIFFDNSLDVLESGLKILLNDNNPLSQLYYSHWPEQIRLAHRDNAVLTNCGNYVVRPWRTFDSITILKSARWRKYWFDQDWEDLQVWRTDALWHAGYELTGPVYSPTKELVRHYDGYSHIGKDISNLTAPLFIPPNFFDKQMKIKVGYNKRDDTVTNLNPTSEWLYNFSKAGTDYRMLSVDIPMFWNDRIINIDENTDYNLTDAQNSAFLAVTKANITTYGTTFDSTNFPPEYWFKNHLYS